MSNMALYRKFRPQDFDEVKGQEHIVTALKNQIKGNHMSHAYMFTGTRGTGKTTVAKVLAKAVNCESPVDGSPCNECPTCKRIDAGSSRNVIEMDAASNNGVDDVRAIIEEVAYKPTEGRYKVYIIDEVHMLSAPAFAALLKTIEEPPEYVIFILATTDIHKVPITILSRCQRYDFRRITIDTISARLAELMEREGIAADEKALRYVAKAGDGSMRDSLSLLDQCIAFYLGEDLTYDKVLSVLGGVDVEVFSNLLHKIIQRDITKAILILEDMVNLGRDLQQFVVDFTGYLRNILLLKDGVTNTEVLEITSEQQEFMQLEAKLIEQESLLRFIRIFSDLSDQMRYSTQKRILVEIALVKLCRPQMEMDHDSMVDRMAAMEAMLEEGSFVLASRGQDGAADGSDGADNAKKPLPEAVPEDVKKVCQSWKQIVMGFDVFMRNCLEAATPTVSEVGHLVLVYEKAGGMSYTKHVADSMERIHKHIEENLGFTVQIDVIFNESTRPKERVYTNAAEAFSKAFNVNVGDLEIQIEEDQ